MRYARFWQAAKLDREDHFLGQMAELDEEEAAAATSGGAASVKSEGTDWSGNYVVEQAVPKVRSLPWLLQLIEDIYDAAKEAERPFRVATGEQNRHRVSIRKRLAREALEKEYLHYDGQDVLKKRGKALQLEKLAAEAEQGSGPGGTFAMDPGSDAHDGGDSELPPLPNFVVTFLEQRHGVRALVRQACLELLMTMEHVRTRNEKSEERRKRLEIQKAQALSRGSSGSDGGGAGSVSHQSKTRPYPE